MIKWLTRRIPDQISALARLKHWLLVERRRSFAHVLHLLEIEPIELEPRLIIHPLGVLGRNVVDLRQILLRNDRIVDMAEHQSRVRVQILPPGVVHHALVQIASLGVLVDFAFVVVVALARDDVIGHFVWRFRDVWAEFIGEAVGCILLVAGVIAIDAHLTVEVE